MKISSFFAFVVASTTAQPSFAFFEFLFGGAAEEEPAGSGGQGVFYLNNQGSDCFVKVAGTPGSPGDYGVNNPKINPGLVCIGSVCNTGKTEGALAIAMSQGDDDNEKTTFSDEIKLECPTEKFEMQFSCPAYDEAVTIESVTCEDETGPCTPLFRTTGGTVELDKDGAGKDLNTLKVVFKCTAP